MKTRIIKTKILDDPKVDVLSKNARFLLLSLLVCPEIGMTGCFEINRRVFLARTCLTPEEYNAALLELVDAKLIAMQENWVFVKKAPKHNRYWVSESNHKTVSAELEQIPEPLRLEVAQALDAVVEGSTVYSTVYSGLKYKIKKRNSKRENINNKETGYTETLELENIIDDVYSAIGMDEDESV